VVLASADVAAAGVDVASADVRECRRGAPGGDLPASLSQPGVSAGQPASDAAPQPGGSARVRAPRSWQPSQGRASPAEEEQDGDFRDSGGLPQPHPQPHHLQARAL